MKRFTKHFLPMGLLLLLAVPAQVSATQQETVSLDNLQTQAIYQTGERCKCQCPSEAIHILYGLPGRWECQWPEVPGLPSLPNRPENPGTPEQPGTPELPTDPGIENYEKQVAELVNAQRSKQGLAPLTLSTKLCAVAEAKAADMRDQNYFSHTSPTYGSPFDMMKQFGLNYKSAGENIAKGQKTPESVMDGWMNSQGHKENILNSAYTEIGVGYVTDSKGATYWVQMFIRP